MFQACFDRFSLVRRPCQEVCDWCEPSCFVLLRGVFGANKATKAAGFDAHGSFISFVCLLNGKFLGFALALLAAVPVAPACMCWENVKLGISHQKHSTTAQVEKA